MTPNRSPRFVSRLTRDTLALILAGGRGSRLKQLTDWRAKPAVPFGGKFRIIDFPLSNCVNSGIRQVAVLTQYKSHSLIRHIQHGWGFLRAELGEFVEVLPAQQRIETSWYEGTAERRAAEPRHHPPPRPGLSCWSWPAITSTRWITAACWPRTSRAAPTSPSAASRCRWRRRAPSA